MKAFLFDLDGTLIDSIADIHDAINRMLAESGYPLVPFDTFPQYFGDGARALVERVLPPEVLSPQTVDDGLAAYQRHYAETWNLRTHIFEGILPALQQLTERGVRLAVLSNKADAFTQLCTRHFFPDTPFEIILGSRDGYPRKPHPQVAMEMAAAMGLAPQDCAYIGDSGIDVEMSRRAGMLAVGVTWGFDKIETLHEKGVEVLLHKPSELLDIKGI